MAVPRKKHSKARSKRKISMEIERHCLYIYMQRNFNTSHLRHRAYKVDGVLYYKEKF